MSRVNSVTTETGKLRSGLADSGNKKVHHWGGQSEDAERGEDEEDLRARIVDHPVVDIVENVVDHARRGTDDYLVDFRLGGLFFLVVRDICRKYQTIGQATHCAPSPFSILRHLGLLYRTGNLRVFG